MSIGYGEHDASRFAISMCGIILSGFGKDSAITIEPNADHREGVVGVDGHAVSSQLNDKSAVVTCTLMETAPAHRALLALYNLDQATRGGAGTGVFEMRDLTNGDVDSSQVANIMRRPDRKVAGSASEYEWKFWLARWETSVPA